MMDARETQYTPFPSGGDMGFMEAHDTRGSMNASAIAAGSFTIHRFDNRGEYPGSPPGYHDHDYASRSYPCYSPATEEWCDDRFASNSNRDALCDSFYDFTSTPSWYPSGSSPSMLLNTQMETAPTSSKEYSTDNMNSECEAQSSRPESDAFHLYSAMVPNFDDGVDLFEDTYYPPSGIDGGLDFVCDPEATLQPLAAAARATPSTPIQHLAFQGSSSDIAFRTANRLELPGQSAPMMMPARTREESRQPIPTFIMPQQHTQTLVSSPFTVISPPSSVKSSPQKRNASVEIPVPPKRRVIKPHMTTKVDNSEDFEIKKDSEKSPTGIYQEYFHSFDEAEKKLERLVELYRKPRESCSFPVTDRTFPKCDDDKIAYVKHLFDAINDWSNFREWSQALKTEDRNRVMDRLRREKKAGDGAAPDKKLGDISLDDMRPSQQELELLLPPLDMQQKKILGRLLSDQTVEWLCWGLIEAAVQSQKGITQIPHWCGADGA